MNSKVHSVIMKSAIDLCGTKFAEELNKPINKERWEEYLESKLEFDMSDDGDYKNSHTRRFHFETYADLLIYGAYMEDQTEFASDVPDSHLTNGFFDFLINIKGEGKHLHWLEHYWGDDLERGKGLELTEKYVCHVLNEAFGVDSLWGEYYGKAYEMIVDVIVKPLTLIFNGSTTYDSFRAAPDRANDYWEKLIEQYHNGDLEAAYFNLGKVCHLLEDMCTPAHVHGDCHLGSKWIGYAAKEYLGLNLSWLFADRIDDDQYEQYTGDMIEPNIPTEKIDGNEHWKRNLQDALPDRWKLTNENGFMTYNPDWDFMKYFEEAARITREYDSDDCDGKGNGHPYRWRHFDPLSFASWDLERRWDGDLTNYACDQIAGHLIPMSIGYTAGLLYAFSDAVGLPFSKDLVKMNFKVTDFTVVDDEDNCAEGEIYLTAQINNATRRTGRFKANSGDSYGENDSRLKELEYSFAATDLSTNELKIHTEAYDNDDWDILGETIHEASDSLGYTDETYYINELPSKYSEEDLESSNGDYKITYDITKVAAETIEMADQYRRTRFKEGETYFSNPILLDMKNMRRHCAVGTNRVCKDWRKSKSGTYAAFYMTEDELFEEHKVDVVERLRKAGKQDPKMEKFAEIADEIAKSEDENVKIALEPSIYKKFIRLKSPDEKVFKRWSRINKNNMTKKFDNYCTCCLKPYLSCMSRGGDLREYTQEKIIWYPVDKNNNCKKSYEELREAVYR